MAFTITTQPLYGQGGTYTANADRLMLKAMTITGGTRHLGAPSAGLMTGDLAVTPGTAGALNIAAGEAVLPGVTGAGHYFVVNDASLATSAVTGNSSGSTRLDLVILRVQDTGAAPTIAAVVLPGTPGSATPPALTVSSTVVEIALAQITVLTGYVAGTVIASSAILDLRRKAFLDDFSVPAANNTTVPNPQAGNLVYDATTLTWKGYESTAAAWVPLVTQGAWTSYTPTFGGTGWALGNGTAFGGWTQIGKTVAFWARIVFGTTSTFGAGRPAVGLPTTAISGSTLVTPILNSEAESSTQTFILMPRIVAARTAVEFYAERAVVGALGTVYIDIASVNSNVPFTWASTHVIYLRGLYETT